MKRLSSALTNLKPQSHYQIVIVGSGYGGAITAYRLARAGWHVCVLERGKELHPGEYPNTLPQVLAEAQVSLPRGRHLGSSTGLYDFHVNQELTVFVGCGLGGTSLINANVALPADPQIFMGAPWPKGLSEDLATLEEGYVRAEKMLKPTPYPTNHDLPVPKKLEALEASARALSARMTRPPITVTFEDGKNHVGIEQPACTHCGDCISGCNYGAKNTLLMNYLPAAYIAGAEIYTEVSVKWLTQHDGRWQVHYQVAAPNLHNPPQQTQSIEADYVILAAGTLGSTEILLRSAKQHDLPISEQLGRHFTGNGDVLGFGYREEPAINGVGYGNRRADPQAPVGPCITGMIDLRDSEKVEEQMVIQEGAIPGALAPLLPSLFAVSEAFGEFGKKDQTQKAETVFTPLINKAQIWDHLRVGEYDEAPRHIQTYLVMGHDNGAGRIDLEKDRLRIRWPNIGMQGFLRRTEQKLVAAAEEMGGKYIKNQLWRRLAKWTTLTSSELITVHPLGGCVMADDAKHGVVNHKGQVFHGPEGDGVHETLYVCDGSTIPRSLGVNPLLTIAALAERCSILFLKDHPLPQSTPRTDHAGADHDPSSQL